jgi:hypothetical protein
MFGTPFCTHEFSEEQLSTLEKVACPCGNRYLSKDLREFNRLRNLIAEQNQNLSSLVSSMANFSTSNQLRTEVPAQPIVTKPAKPKRERPNLSVTQWLIVVAGFMVLVAASVFVSQNLASWNVYGWSALELSLGLLAGFGAFKSKRFSILLSNFLAVFSSAMLLTLIMSIGTTFGWGFDAWNSEPAWFWALNLAVVGSVSLGLGMWSKNFGWRAMAPLSLSAAAIVLVVNSAGTFEDRWRIAVLSIVLFIVLIAVKLSRNAKWELPSGPDRAYLEDLQTREDNSLKRFGVAISILLVGFAAFDLLEALTLRSENPLDGVATLVAAAVWLLGARINRRWVSAIADADKTVLTMRDAASGIGLTFLGLGVLSLLYGSDYRVGLTVAITMLFLVFALERFAKILLLPTIAVTVSSWVTALFGAIWYLNQVQGPFETLALPLGLYLVGFTLALASREIFNFKLIRSYAIYATGLVGSGSLAVHYLNEFERSTPQFAATLALALVAVNLTPLLVGFILKNAKAETSPATNWIPLAQSSLVAIVGALGFGAWENSFFLLTVGSGFLLVTLAGMLSFKTGAIFEKLSQQAYVAIGFSLLLTAVWGGTDSLKTSSAFILLNGLLLLTYALLAKNILWANIGYAITSISIVAANSAWLTNQNAGLIASAAIVIGALGNLGLISASQRFGGKVSSTKLVTRITTGISLIAILFTAQRFIPLPEVDSWVLLAVPAAIAVVMELRKPTDFSFIYLGAGALGAALYFYQGQNVLQYDLRITLVSALLAGVLVRRSLATKNLGWVAGSQVSAGVFGFFAARVLDEVLKLTWTGPELYSFSIAISLAVTALITRKAHGKFGDYLTLDIPVLVATVPSVLFALTNTSGDITENATRLLVATGIIWMHNVWRTLQRGGKGWLIAQFITGLLFAWSAVREIYITTDLVWDGPELYSIAVLGITLVGLRLAGRQNLLTSSLYRFGLTLAVAITPSALYSWTSVTKQFAELDVVEITRTLLVVAIGVAAMVLGILRANRGLNLAGTINLWLIGVPGLWFKTSSVENGAADLELRGLLVAAVVFWAISLLRQYTNLKLRSIVFIGIPVSIALAPAIFQTISSLGGTEIRSLDWWRFSIVLSISLVLLLVGSLREIGGTFFPGLIGVIVTVLPFGFHPLSNKEWFLWAILLGVAGLLVWLAVRLENMRKAGREPSVWLKELK